MRLGLWAFVLCVSLCAVGGCTGQDAVGGAGAGGNNPLPDAGGDDQDGQSDPDEDAQDPQDTGDDPDEDVQDGPDSDDEPDADEPDVDEPDGDDEPNEGDPCQSPDACDEGLTCLVRVLDGGAVEALCLEPNDNGRPPGAACDEHLQCAANLCLEGVLTDVCSHPCEDDADCEVEGYRCRERQLTDNPESTLSLCEPPAPSPCLSDAECSDGLRCLVVPNLDATALIAVCGDPPGQGEPGEACDQDQECASGICLQGFCSALCQGADGCGEEQLCELRALNREGLAAAFEMCRTLPPVECLSDDQCTEGNRVCGSIESTEDAVSLTCTDPAVDGGILGAPCEGTLSLNDQCFSRLCLRGVTDECTAACVDNDDCAGGPGGYICTEFRFAGERLRLCADSCEHDEDCEREGQLCGFGRNEGDDRFEFVCRNPMGEDGPGSDCSEEVNCLNGICLIRPEERVCTVPCVTDDDCPDVLPVCGDATITRPSGDDTQTLRVCTIR